MELKGSRTEANLWIAFAGESQARNKYDYYASKAKKEGYEQIGGQLRAGLILTHVFEDTNGSGNLHAHNLPTFWATRSVKPEK